MADILRGLLQCSSEQEARELRREIARTARAGRQPPPPTPPLYTPPRPEFPGGIVPVFVINQPVRRLR